MAIRMTGEAESARPTSRRGIVPALMVAAALGAAAIVVIISVVEQLRGRDSAIAFAEGRMRAAVGELSSTVGGRLAGMDSDLIAIVNSLDLVDGEIRLGSTSTLLARLRLGEGRGAQYLVVDASGRIVLDSEGRRTGGPIIADRPYFRHHHADTSPLPYLVWVEASNVTGRPTLGVSRRLEDAYGTFGGVIAAGIDPESHCCLH